jgi:hypothetical protein
MIPRGAPLEPHVLGDGRTLGAGAPFLLPYYLGFYHGFIKE